MKKSGLTPREKRFCKFVIDCFYNLSEAARMAGYSEKSARHIGSETYAKPYIQQEIERLERESEKTAKISKTAIAMLQKKIITDKNTEPAERQRAIQCLVDMYGYSAPVKSDINVRTDQQDTAALFPFKKPTDE